MDVEYIFCDHDGSNPKEIEALVSKCVGSKNKQRQEIIGCRGFVPQHLRRQCKSKEIQVYRQNYWKTIRNNNIQHIICTFDYNNNNNNNMNDNIIFNSKMNKLIDIITNQIEDININNNNNNNRNNIGNGDIPVCLVFCRRGGIDEMNKIYRQLIEQKRHYTNARSFRYGNYIQIEKCSSIDEKYNTIKDCDVDSKQAYYYNKQLEHCRRTIPQIRKVLRFVIGNSNRGGDGDNNDNYKRSRNDNTRAIVVITRDSFGNVNDIHTNVHTIIHWDFDDLQDDQYGYSLQNLKIPECFKKRLRMLYGISNKTKSYIFTKNDPRHINTVEKCIKQHLGIDQVNIWFEQ